MKTETKEETEKATRLEVLEISSIAPSPTNPRRNLGDLAELAASIKAEGVLQPVTVRFEPELSPGGEDYELVLGHRRLAAAEKAGLEKIPAIVVVMTAAQVIRAQLIENVQREDIHPIDEAEAYERLLGRQHKMTVDEVAARVGKSKAFVYARLKLLTLTKKSRAAFLKGEISASVALLLARIPVAGIQDKALSQINVAWRRNEGNPLSARQVFSLIEREYMLKLHDAPFSKKDPGLVPDAGSCLECTKRTGNQAELFADVKSADVCTDPICFRAKLDAHWTLAKDTAAETGAVVLSEAEAKKVFPGPGGTWVHGGYEELSTYCPHGGTGKKSLNYGQFLNKAGVEYQKTLTRDGAGNIRELISTAELGRALKAAGVKGAGRPGKGPQFTAAQKRATTRSRVIKATASRAVEEIGKVASKGVAVTARGFWPLLLELVRPSVHSSPAKTVLERRGLAVKASAWHDGSAAFRKKIEKITEAEARGTLVELLLADRCEYMPSGHPAELKAAAAHFKVDLKKLELELAKKKAPAVKKKKAPARSSKGRKK